jgi:hypothetical protein
MRGHRDTVDPENAGTTADIKKKTAGVYFNPGRVGVSWEIVVELAKADISLRREPDEPWTARKKSGFKTGLR